MLWLARTPAARLALKVAGPSGDHLQCSTSGPLRKLAFGSNSAQLCRSAARPPDPEVSALRGCDPFAPAVLRGFRRPARHSGSTYHPRSLPRPTRQRQRSRRSWRRRNQLAPPKYLESRRPQPNGLDRITRLQQHKVGIAPRCKSITFDLHDARRHGGDHLETLAHRCL